VAVTKPSAATSIWWVPTRRRPSQIPRPTTTESIATLAPAGVGSTWIAAPSSSAASDSAVTCRSFTGTDAGCVPSSPSPRSATVCTPTAIGPSQRGVLPTTTPSTSTSSALPLGSVTWSRPISSSLSARRRTSVRAVLPPATSTRVSKGSKPSL
jgi:hypothetical protein